MPVANNHRGCKTVINWHSDERSEDIEIHVDLSHADLILEALKSLESNFEVQRMQRDLRAVGADDALPPPRAADG
jgi:hypothetical protein